MATCFTQLLRDESGLVVSAELIMIITIAVISLTAGWGAVSAMLAEELEDVANSMGSLNQSFNYNGIIAPGHASCSGGGFNDNRNFVNVSTSSNFNAQNNFGAASVAGGGFVQQSVAVAEAQVEVAEEPFVLVEEEFGVDIQIDEQLLLCLVEQEIVTICEDGSVVLLREDLVEILEDGSIQILDERIRCECEAAILKNQTEQPVRVHGNLEEGKEAHKESDTTRKEFKRHSREDSDGHEDSAELRRENARLRELIERLRR